MSAFAGLRIPYERPWPSQKSDTPPNTGGCFVYAEPAYVYPWGRKERNPFFIGPYLEESDMNNLRQYEKDESQNLRKIVEQMNNLHAQMGGRDSRPERKALVKAMTILQKEIDRGRAA